MLSYSSTKWRPACAGLIVAFLFLGLLQWLVLSNRVSPFVVPPPTGIISAIPELFIKENLAILFIVTFGTTFAATFLSVMIGFPIGWLMHRFPVLGSAYESWFGAIFSAPIILLYPLFLVVLGRSIWTIIVMSIVAGITPVILSTYRGLCAVPRVYLNVARSFNMRERDMVWKVLLPAALPSIFTGIRLTLIYTMINVVAMEFLISIGGLGYLVGDLYDRYELPLMYAAVVFVVVASIIFFSLINRLEQWLK